jgi:hypothetical protein
LALNAMPEAGPLEHVEVVGAVADGDGLEQETPASRGEAFQRARLAGPVDDRTESRPVSRPSTTSRVFAAA